MNYDMILNKVISLWRESGAELRGEPKEMQYLTKQARPTTVKLLLEFGNPKILYTPDSMYEIKSIRRGNVRHFNTLLSYLFEIDIITPEYLHNSALSEAASAASEMIVAIKGIKPQEDCVFENIGTHDYDYHDFNALDFGKWTKQPMTQR